MRIYLHHLLAGVGQAMIFFIIILSSTNAAHGQIKEKVVGEKYTTIWEILWGPDDLIWLTERGGKVSTLDPQSGEKKLISTITEVYEYNESGLMGMALHPDFASKPYVYLGYTYQDNGIKIKVARYEYSSGALTNPTALIDGVHGSSNHDGCRIVFGPDGKLYVSFGDALIPASAQDPASLNGKVLRMNDDGSIPADNPDPATYVWCTGLRNTQGLVWANGKLYGSDHGPSNDDELNLLQKGGNYGWPNVEGYCDKATEIDFCNNNNVIEPLTAWTPTIAPAGVDFYADGPIMEYNNSLLMTTLKGSELVQMKLTQDGTAITETSYHFVKEYGRLRDICISPAGRIYLATSNRDGRGAPIAADDRIIELSGPQASMTDAGAVVSDITLYPNPAKDAVMLNGPASESYNWEICDMQGRSARAGKTTGRLNLPLTDLPNGMYLVRISAGNSTACQKLIIDR